MQFFLSWDIAKDILGLHHWINGKKQHCFHLLTKPWLEGWCAYMPIPRYWYFCSGTNTSTTCPKTNATSVPSHRAKKEFWHPWCVKISSFIDIHMHVCVCAHTHIHTHTCNNCTTFSHCSFFSLHLLQPLMFLHYSINNETLFVFAVV